VAHHQVFAVRESAIEPGCGGTLIDREIVRSVVLITSIRCRSWRYKAPPPRRARYRGVAADRHHLPNTPAHPGPASSTAASSDQREMRISS
jgi:hypothetical protein